MERLREEKLKIERSRGVRLGMERLEGVAGNGEAEGGGHWEMGMESPRGKRLEMEMLREETGAAKRGETERGEARDGEP